MELWMNLHSSTQMKEMYPDMAWVVWIPARKRFSWAEMSNELEQLKMLLTQLVEMLTAWLSAIAKNDEN